MSNYTSAFSSSFSYAVGRIGLGASLLIAACIPVQSTGGISEPTDSGGPSTKLTAGHDNDRGAMFAYDGNYKEAAPLFEKACNDGVAEGCYNLALMHRDGLGMVQNQFRAASLLEKVCEGDAALTRSGIANACIKAAEVFRDRLGNAPRAAALYFRAASLLEKVCEGDAALTSTYVIVDACIKAAEVFKDRLGNAPRAAALYLKACDHQGGAEGCFQHGMMLRHGVGVAQDQTRAAVLLGKACDLRHEGACVALQILRESTPE